MAERSNSMTLWDDHLSKSFQKFLTFSNPIGSVVKKQAELVHEVYYKLRFVIEQSTSVVPDTPEVGKCQHFLGKYVERLAESIAKVHEHRENHRDHLYFTHLSTVGESIEAFNWVVVKQNPTKFIRDCKGIAACYANKVINDFKSKGYTHVEWAKSWLEVLDGLESFVRAYSYCGMIRNLEQLVIPFTDASSRVLTRSHLTLCEKFKSEDKGNKKGAGALSSFPPELVTSFSFLSFRDKFGKSIECAKPSASTPSFTRSNKFRSIDDLSIPSTNWDQTVVDSTTAANVTAISANIVGVGDETGDHCTADAATKDNAKFFIEKGKWRIEHQKNATLEVVPNMQHEVVVHDCENTSISVNSKVTSITMESCRGVRLMFAGVISVVNVNNCRDVKAEALHTLPMMMISNSDAVQVYLNEKALGVQIIHEKSSRISVCFPTGQDGYDEHYVPCQFKTKVIDGELRTEPV